ncbi:unnamed protein product [Protopolystoma xenopodis]|uniref:FIT family protein n=1 Tax=Protopolystoma xenopodis TaxID=117903 RepID=A0A3S5AIJ9_9PLAT|nr:unnamed protein product [Protopolystoma xenopodis]
MKPSSMKKFSYAAHSNQEPIPNSKKSVPGPTSLAQFVAIALFKIFRKPVSIDAMTKAGIYLCLATGGSLIFDILKIPPSYFSNSYNLLNQIFAKWSWGWTCCSLASFIVVSSYIFTGGKLSLMRSHLLRLVFGSACWYIFNGLFNFVENKTGQCHPLNLTLKSTLLRPDNKHLCHRLGGHWLGFDISGHCFITSMCNLWITEELRCMLYWHKLAEIIKPYDNDFSPSSNPVKFNNFSLRDVNIMRSAFRRLTGAARFAFIVLAFLSVLWDVVFVSTIIYFHNLPSKLLGTSFGVLAWFLAYRIIFPSAKSGDWHGFAPGMPGSCALDFVPSK